MQSVSTRRTIVAFSEQIITDILIELKKEKSATIEIIESLENLVGNNLLLKYIKNLKLFIDQFNFSELKMYLFNEFWLTYQSKITTSCLYGDRICENLERSIILTTIDRIWREHLQKMTLLREAVGWRGYGQRNPLYEYKQDAFYFF